MNFFKNKTHRVINYEFWPYWLFYIPVYFYYLILSIKARGPMFPTTVNPCMPHSGCVLESKEQIFSLLPIETYPATRTINPSSKRPQTLEALKLTYPIIAKPDVGERGVGVKLIKNLEELKNYHQEQKQKYLIQDYLDWPFEAGVFYVKLPGKDSFISSLTYKEFFTIDGDGVHTLKELALKSPRYSRYFDQVHALYPSHPWEQVLKKDDSFLIEPIGNHSRGTVFKNGAQYITKEVSDYFCALGDQIKGFSYGRFDIKSKSLESFKKGEEIQILELNGLLSEPAHIYEPSFSLFNAYRDLLKHWSWVYEIAQYNYKEKGISRSKLKEVITLFRDYFFSA